MLLWSLGPNAEGAHIAYEARATDRGNHDVRVRSSRDRKRKATCPHEEVDMFDRIGSLDRLDRSPDPGLRERPDLGCLQRQSETRAINGTTLGRLPIERDAYRRLVPLRVGKPHPPLCMYRFGSRARASSADAWTETVGGQRFLCRIDLVVDEVGSDDRFENDRN